jgi:regulator of RNase E activity RraB
MAEDWDVYFCLIDDHPASAFVDLGIHWDAPQVQRPWLLRIVVTLREPGQDGLGVPEEVDTLYAIEDELFRCVAEGLTARYVGRTTSQGRREFCFYAKSAARLEEQVAVAQRTYPAYSIAATSQQDPAWDYYFDTLYPSDLDLQGIETRRAIDRLGQQGDDLSQPREVVHLLLFPTAQARAEFLRQVESEEFRCEEFSPPEDEEQVNRFGLRLIRRDPVTLEYIDGLVVDLFLRAGNCGGEYDGWETSLTV